MELRQLEHFVAVAVERVVTLGVDPARKAAIAALAGPAIDRGRLDLVAGPLRQA
jgi:hypothetical protein